MCKYINITYEYVLCMYVAYVCFLFIQTIPLSDGVFGYPNETQTEQNI